MYAEGLRLQQAHIDIPFWAEQWGSIIKNSAAKISAVCQEPECETPLPLPILDTRNDLGYLLEVENKTIGVEVGVRRGVFSREILETWPGATQYYLVDLWAHQDNYHDGANVADSEQEIILNAARTNLKKWEAKTIFKQQDSIAAAQEMLDGSVDFVYLDARHDYAAVKEDLEAWWPKLKHGGIFAGHDLEDASDIGSWDVDEDGHRAPTYVAPELGSGERIKAVRAAVLEFAVSVRRQAVPMRRENRYPSWMMRK